MIANVEYWDDTELMGGHWTAEVSASIPFSIYNLVTGRNPFEGAAESFKPRQREFKERMSDMVIRSHRIQTVTSDYTLIDRSRSTKTNVSAVAGPSAPASGGGLGVLE